MSPNESQPTKATNSPLAALVRAARTHHALCSCAAWEATSATKPGAAMLGEMHAAGRIGHHIRIQETTSASWEIDQ